MVLCVAIEKYVKLLVMHCLLDITSPYQHKNTDREG
jgi:hypothetical protein